MANFYNAVFDEKQYKSVTKKAADYYLESGKSSAIPLIQTNVPDAKEYTHVLFAEATGSQGGMEWVESGRKMNVRSNYIEYKIPRIQGIIQIHNKDIANFGASLIADKHAAEIRQLAKDVDDAYFHGAHDETGGRLQEGMIGQITTSQNLSSAAAADLSTKGEIWHWIKEAIEAIPFAMREDAPDMIMWLDEKTFAEASAPDRIYNDKVEWDFIYDQFIGEKSVHGRKIGQVIITNKILRSATDTTTGDGNTQGTADTEGTHGRICIIVPDKRWVARVVSRGFSLIGEEQHMLAVDQLYGHRGRTCVFNTSACSYSEQLTF